MMYVAPDSVVPMDDTTFGLTRRTALKAGLLSTATVVGGLSGSAVAHPDDWSDLSLKDQLSMVKKATAPYKDLQKMDEAGYESAPVSLLCGAGYHFDNLDLWGDGTLDPERPESLLYAVTDDGKLSLGAVEFILVTEKDDDGDPVDPKPDLFNDEDAPLDEPPLRGISEDEAWDLIDDPATGQFIWVLHVWVHEQNPAGVFSLSNPRFEDMAGCVPLEEVL